MIFIGGFLPQHAQLRRRLGDPGSTWLAIFPELRRILAIPTQTVMVSARTGWTSRLFVFAVKTLRRLHARLSKIGLLVRRLIRGRGWLPAGRSLSMLLPSRSPPLRQLLVLVYDLLHLDPLPGRKHTVDFDAGLDILVDHRRELLLQLVGILLNRRLIRPVGKDLPGQRGAQAPHRIDIGPGIGSRLFQSPLDLRFLCGRQLEAHRHPFKPHTHSHPGPAAMLIGSDASDGPAKDDDADQQSDPRCSFHHVRNSWRTTFPLSHYT